jgi:hypothetical protein
MKSKLFIAIMTIPFMPVILASIPRIGPDPDTEICFFYFLENDQFDNLKLLMDKSDPKDIPKLGLDQYYYGNKVAEYYCFLGERGYDSLAFDLWQSLIGTAAKNRECDSALFLAESWVKNMPDYNLPKKALGWAKLAKVEEEENARNVRRKPGASLFSRVKVKFR